MNPHFYCSVCREELDTTHMSGGNAAPDEPLDYHVEPHVCPNTIPAAVAALQRIVTLTDAPDIDATGEWQTGLHCGVEDRACADRYEGADYGHTVGVEKALEWAVNEARDGLEKPVPNQETAEVVAFDGQAMTVTLRFDSMPLVAVGERWQVNANKMN